VHDGNTGEFACLPIAPVDVSADDQLRANPQDRVADGGAADPLPAARYIDTAFRWRVDDQHAVGGGADEQFRGLFLVEVVAPRPERGDRNPAADAVERDPFQGHRRAVQDVRGVPALACRAQFLGRLVVPGDEDGRLVRGAEEVEGEGKVFGVPDVREVAGADQDINARRAPGE